MDYFSHRENCGVCHNEVRSCASSNNFGTFCAKCGCTVCVCYETNTLPKGTYRVIDGRLNRILDGVPPILKGILDPPTADEFVWRVLARLLERKNASSNPEYSRAIDDCIADIVAEKTGKEA